MKTLGAAMANLGLPRRDPPDPGSPEELERFVIDRRLFSIERLEDMLAQLDDERDRPALERELELARLAAAAAARRPAGCWCLGLGGMHRVYLPYNDEALPGWRTWCRCDVGAAQKLAYEERQRDINRARIQRNLDAMWGSVPSAFRDWTLDTLARLGPQHQALANRLWEWLADDRWLYLHGPTGRAKTGSAIGCLHALVELGWTGLFEEVRDLLWHLRSTYADVNQLAIERDRRWESLYDVEVLVLDDLGAERRTDWANETLGQLISIRHRRLRRTIITSNLNLVDLGEHLGDARTSSRIAERADVVDCSNLPNLRLERSA